MELRPTGVSPRVVVSSFLDATERTLEPVVARTLDVWTETKQIAGDSLQVSAKLYRGGSTLTEKRLKGLLSAALKAGGAVATALAHLAALFTGDPSLPIFTEASAQELLARRGESQSQRESRWAHEQLRGGDWKGQRLYEITAQGAHELQRSADSRPQAEQLQQQVKDSLSQFPSATHIVHIFGHGGGRFNLAEMPVVKVAQALENAQSQSGRSADVLYLESCKMGNLEGLMLLSNSAQVAVASEKDLEISVQKGVPGQNLLTPEALAEVALQGGDALQVAKSLVRQVAQQKQSQHTMAAFDLKDLRDQLKPAMERLGETLSEELKAGKFDPISECLDQAAIADSSFGYRDLAGFLKQLAARREDFSAATQEAVLGARKAIAASVEAVSLSPEAHAQGLTGLSFQDARAWKSEWFEKSYRDEGGMGPAWTDFQISLNRAFTEKAAAATPPPRS